MFTDTSPVLCKDANPYKVALAFVLLLDLVWKLKKESQENWVTQSRPYRVIVLFSNLRIQIYV